MNATQFCLFTRQHREALARVALNFFHDTEAAADIVQETLLRLWVVRARLRAEADFLALGIRIAKNLCVNEWKRRQLHAVAGEPMPETPSSTDTAAPLCMLPSLPSPPPNAASSTFGVMNKWRWHKLPKSWAVCPLR